ncbi:MAG: sulfite exporter TauE/SafE family protein [Gammaproteobacteria bacterium]|jgi:uncharacterized membrane protein YfcA
MAAETIVIVLVAFFIAAFLKGISGVGFSTICLGLLAMFLEPKLAIPLVFLPSLSSNLIVMLESGHFIVSIKRFWILFLSALPGLVLGILFLNSSGSDGPRLALGIIMLIYSLWAFSSEVVDLSEKMEKRLLIPVGIISGMVNGATGSQIMPIMPFLLSLKMDRNVLVQTMNCAFTFNTLVMLTGFGKIGLLTVPVLSLSVAGILPVALGVYLGGRIRRRSSEVIFRKIVLGLLMLMGLVLITMVLL